MCHRGTEKLLPKTMPASLLNSAEVLIWEYTVQLLLSCSVWPWWSNFRYKLPRQNLLGNSNQKQCNYFTSIIDILAPPCCSSCSSSFFGLEYFLPMANACTRPDLPASKAHTPNPVLMWRLLSFWTILTLISPLPHPDLLWMILYWTVFSHLALIGCCGAAACYNQNQYDSVLKENLQACGLS